jgi:hypothetical protein
MHANRSAPVRARSSLLALFLLFLGLGCAPASNEAASEDSKPPSSNPRYFDGYYRPDYLPPLVKSALGTSGAVQTADRKIPPFTPKASAEFNYRLSMEQAGTPVMDAGPQASVPSVGLVGFLSPLLIISNKRQMFIIFEGGGSGIWRIDLDRDHPKNLRLTSSGDSVGRWDGNTLVVDTVGFNNGGRLDLVGTPFSKDLHMVTRISKINGGRQLEFLITFDDPMNFIQPFTARYTATWRPDERLMENEIDRAPPPTGAE